MITQFKIYENSQSIIGDIIVDGGEDNNINDGDIYIINNLNLTKPNYYGVFIIRGDKCFNSVKLLKNPKIIPVEKFFKTEEELVDVFYVIDNSTFHVFNVKSIIFDVWKEKLPIINMILTTDKYNL